MTEYFMTQKYIVQPTFGALHFAHQRHISKFALHLCIVVYISHMPNMHSRLYKL